MEKTLLLNIANRKKNLNQLKILMELIQNGERLLNLEFNRMEYTQWRNHCEITLESAVKEQNFSNKFKCESIRGPRDFDNELLKDKISNDIALLKSFLENTARQKVGIWFAIGLDSMFLLKLLWSKIWDLIREPVGLIVFLIVTTFGVYYLQTMFKQPSQINTIAHDVVCNKYGVCDTEKTS